MAILEVICKTAAIQNNSQWPCSMCPIPQLRLVGVRTSYIYIFFLLDTLSSGAHYTSPLAPHTQLHPVTLPRTHTGGGHLIHFLSFTHRARGQSRVRALQAGWRCPNRLEPWVFVNPEILLVA